jgi:hypothetical protein
MGMIQEFFEVRKPDAFPVPSPLVLRLFLSVFRLLLTSFCLPLTSFCLSLPSFCLPLTSFCLPLTCFCLLPFLLFLREERLVVWGTMFDHRAVEREGKGSLRQGS